MCVYACLRFSTRAFVQVSLELRGVEVCFYWYPYVFGFQIVIGDPPAVSLNRTTNSSVSPPATNTTRGTNSTVNSTSSSSKY